MGAAALGPFARVGQAGRGQTGRDMVTAAVLAAMARLPDTLVHGSL